MLNLNHTPFEVIAKIEPHVWLNREEIWWYITTIKCACGWVCLILNILGTYSRIISANQLPVILLVILFCRAHFTVNDELPNRLSCGTVRGYVVHHTRLMYSKNHFQLQSIFVCNLQVRVRPNIRAFTRTGVLFEDGEEACDVDQVTIYLIYY